MMQASSLFPELKARPSGHAFTVAPIPGYSGSYLGVSMDGLPCLFVEADDRFAEAPLRTAQVSLQLDREYILVIGDDPPTHRRYHSLSCEASDRPGVETLLVLIDAFLSQHGGHTPTGHELYSFFRSLVRLFAVEPAWDLTAERQGLWGELFIMRLVRGFRFWAPFWHGDVTRRFDFSAQLRRIDVKTAAGGLRIHHFSHRQLYALEGEEIVVASLLLREQDTGLSLRSLIEECRAGLQGTPFYLKIEAGVRRAGMEDASETGPVFDSAEAERTLAWFRSTDVPHFLVPEPPGVFDTHYRVDLSMAPGLSQCELEAWLDSWPNSSAKSTAA